MRRVHRAELTKSGRNASVVKMKLRNLLSSGGTETVYRADDKFETVQLEKKDATYSYFADPMYEGNRGFAGWKLVGYPGPRYNYDNEIRHYGQPYPLPTVGLLGRDPSRRIAS